MSRHGPYRSAPQHPSVHRNPWTQGHVYCSDSRSTHSSGSSHTYHVLNGPQIAQNPVYYHDPESHPREGVMPPYREVYRSSRHPLEAGMCVLPAESTGKYLLSRALPRPQIVPTNIPPELTLVDNGRRSRPVSSRAATPVSGGTEPAAIVPCGGHCVALENFCHYFLQVAFLGGVLSGLCLVVGGRVLRKELGVLTYIGSLTALVSAALLWVQCRVRRPPRRRHPRQPNHHPAASPEVIPLHHLPPPPPAPPIRTIQEQPAPDFREESGIPWWRRENLVT